MSIHSHRHCIRTFSRTRFASLALRSIAGLIGCSLMAFNSPVLAQSNYTMRDAQHVTTSENIDVLGYVVCLHDAFQQQPRSASNEQALDAAISSCRSLEGDFASDARAPKVEEIRLSILECGFTSEQAGPACDAGDSVSGQSSAGAVQSSGTESQQTMADGAVETLQPHSITTEQSHYLIGDENFVFAASFESNQVLKFDVRSRQLVDGYDVGWLVEEMIYGTDGLIYFVVNAEKSLYSITSNGERNRIAVFDWAPCRLTSSDPREIWVLFRNDCTFDKEAQLVRVSTQTGAVGQIVKLGKDAAEVVDYVHEVWASYRGGKVAIVNKRTLDVQFIQLDDATLGRLEVTNDFIFGAGRPSNAQQYNPEDGGVVVKIDPVNRREIARRQFPEYIFSLAVGADPWIYAIDSIGTVYVLDHDLNLLRTFKSSTGGYLPLGSAHLGKSLAVNTTSLDGNSPPEVLFFDQAYAGKASSTATGGTRVGGGQSQRPQRPQRPRRGGNVPPPPKQ